jgi:hypothetical protein
LHISRKTKESARLYLKRDSTELARYKRKFQKGKEKQKSKYMNSNYSCPMDND